MPPQAALFLCVLLVWWLLARDSALRGGCSRALWISVLWLGIIGSRPISAWLGTDVGADVNVEGSPLDRLVFLGLILAGILTLRRRKVNWVEVAAANKWLFLFLIYLGISTLWADNPFVSFKRWIKELGNIVVVLIILSEEDPVGAVKSVLFRLSSILLPLSVVLIKYYPDEGRYFNPFIWSYSYGGVTTDKNTLGMTLFACAIGLHFGFLDVWKQRAEHRKEVFAHLLLLGTCLWLWAKAHCSTSMACSGLGIGLLSAAQYPAIRRALERGALWGLAALSVLVLGLSTLFNPMEIIAGGLGRDVTLTGRTDIWREVLRVKINPWLGTGYGSFWQPERADEVSNALNFYFRLKEAHDGYLEVYLNNGMVGLAFVMILLLGAARRLIHSLGAGDSFAAFCFVALVGAAFYNITESALSGLIMLWVMALLAIIRFPRHAGAVRDGEEAAFQTGFPSREPRASAFAEPLVPGFPRGGLRGLVSNF